MRLFLLLFFSIFSILNLSAQRADGRIMLQVRLSGAQEVPSPVNTKAKSLVTIFIEEDYMSITVDGIMDSMSSEVTGFLIHEGGIGISGPVLLDLTPYVTGNRIYGNIPKLPETTITKLMSGNTYIDIHTIYNSAGELRGQIYPEADLMYTCSLRGVSEVPPVVNDPHDAPLGNGYFILSAPKDSIHYKLLVTFPGSPIIGVNLYYGDKNTNGTKILSLNFKKKLISGAFAVPTGFLDSLNAKKVYINVLTEKNPDGALRSQLFFAGYSVFTADLTGDQVIPPVTNTSAAAVLYGYSDPNYSLHFLTYVVAFDSLLPNNSVDLYTKDNKLLNTGSAGLYANIYSAWVTIVDSTTLTDLFKGNFYAVGITSTHPNGEIRGRLKPLLRDGFVADMCADQEVPKNNSKAKGLAAVSIDRNRSDVHYELLTTGLTNKPTGVFLNNGVKGTNGPILLDIGKLTANQNGSGAGYISTGFADSIAKNLTYFNIFTPANPNGEIRGQVSKQVSTECLLSGNNDLNAQLLKLNIFPNPVQDLVQINFNSNETYKAQYNLTDFTGKIIFRNEINIQNGNNDFEISLSDVPTGIYFITVRALNNLLFTEKIIKL